METRKISKTIRMERVPRSGESHFKSNGRFVSTNLQEQVCEDFVFFMN